MKQLPRQRIERGGLEKAGLEKSAPSHRGQKSARRGKGGLPSTFTGVRFKGHANDRARAFKNVKYLRDQKARNAYLRQRRSVEVAGKEKEAVAAASDDSGGEGEGVCEIDKLIDPLKSPGSVRKRGEEPDGTDQATREPFVADPATAPASRQPAEDKSAERSGGKRTRPNGAAERDSTSSAVKVHAGSSRKGRAGVEREGEGSHRNPVASEQNKSLYVPFNKALEQARTTQQEHEKAILEREETRRQKQELVKASKKRRMVERKAVMRRTQRGQIVMGSVIERLLKKNSR